MDVRPLDLSWWFLESLLLPIAFFSRPGATFFVSAVYLVRSPEVGGALGVVFFHRTHDFVIGEPRRDLIGWCAGFDEWFCCYYACISAVGGRLYDKCVIRAKPFPYLDKGLVFLRYSRCLHWALIQHSVVIFYSACDFIELPNKIKKGQNKNNNTICS